MPPLVHDLQALQQAALEPCCRPRACACMPTRVHCSSLLVCFVLLDQLSVLARPRENRGRDRGRSVASREQKQRNMIVDMIVDVPTAPRVTSYITASPANHRRPRAVPPVREELNGVTPQLYLPRTTKFRLNLIAYIRLTHLSCSRG